MTKENEELQQRKFWSLYEPSELQGKIVSRIGSDLLCQQPGWLQGAGTTMRPVHAGQYA